MNQKSNVLTLRIARYWFDLILIGEKKVEYRELKPFYEKRIGDGKDIRQVLLIAGYAANSPRMYVNVKKVIINKKKLRYEIHLDVDSAVVENAEQVLADLERSSKQKGK